MAEPSAAPVRLSLLLRGTVQGVGLRPWLAVEARRRGLVGHVRNTSLGVALEVQGDIANVAAFKDVLSSPPGVAVVTSVEERSLPCMEQSDFQILSSATRDGAANTANPIAPDVRVCSACLAEVDAANDRRYGYAFTSCSHCGPRFTIAEGQPYDRARTTMREFELCAACRREYEDPADRRFHAQAIACPQCGPQLVRDAEHELPAVTLDEALRVLAEGRIVALLGIGGFQLLVDASNDAAVLRLRQRKRRPSKAFAVLFSDLAALTAHCRVSADEEALLTGAAGPIVLLRRHSDREPVEVSSAPSDDEAAQTGSVRAALAEGASGAAFAGATALSAAIAPGSPQLGALLPTSPLHHVLAARFGKPLVCTSGNLSDEPLCITTEAARERLSGIADVLVSHDRRVLCPLDDSVAQVVRGKTQLLRRARGYVPQPSARLPAGRCVLALGAHHKSSFTLALDGQALTSPHLGDLDTPLARAGYEGTLRRWLRQYGASPELIVCDQHLGYATSMLGEQLAQEWGVPLMRVQHHHAHVASVMAEHAPEDALLGLAWDGAGWGDDGTLWGGEALWCEGERQQRVASLRQFALPGAARAMHEPRRSAMGLLHAAGQWQEVEARNWFEVRELSTLRVALERGINCPSTSSIGRLFDAAAALAGVRLCCDFEGQAAVEWMGLAQRAGSRAGAYELWLGEDGVADWQPLVEALLSDVKRSVSVEVIARRFHEALVGLALGVARQQAAPMVALVGGCFQNALLLERVSSELERAGISVLLNESVPPNDGGISLGQAWLGVQFPR